MSTFKFNAIFWNFRSYFATNWLNWFLDLIDCSTCRFTRIANWICTWTWSPLSDQTINNNLEWIYCLLTICNLLLKNKKFSKIWYFRGIGILVQMPHTAKLMSNSWSAPLKNPGGQILSKIENFRKNRSRIQVVPPGGT